MNVVVRVYRRPVSKETIEVDARAYARLVELAAARGIPVGEYVDSLVGIRPERTRAEREEIARQTEEYLREHFGFNPTPEERAKALAWFAKVPTETKAQLDRRASA